MKFIKVLSVLMLRIAKATNNTQGINVIKLKLLTITVVSILHSTVSYAQGNGDKTNVLPSNPQEQKTVQATGADFIEVFEQLAGKQPGIRKGHAKGVCAEATFTPSAQGKNYSTSPLFSNTSAANIRFSMAGGNPNANETSRSPRGIGVQFILDDGSVHNIAGLTTPVFPGKDPETFLGLLKTLVPNEQGRIDFAKVANYRQENPSTLGQYHWLQKHNPPASYASANYFGIHTFYFIDAQGKQQKFKWQLVPVTGEKTLTHKAMTTLPDTFLAQRLQDELTKGRKEFLFQAVLGEKSDSDTDPSVYWPASRKVINLGTLSLFESGGDGCKLTNYDPNLVISGIKPSQDRVLMLRSAAYAISFGKRLTGQ